MAATLAEESNLTELGLTAQQQPLLADANYFSSRLLGQNRFFAEVGAVIDVELKHDIEKIAALYLGELERLLAVLPIKNYQLKLLTFSNGFNLALSYPYDLLLVACEILDWVWCDIVDLLDEGIALNLASSKRRFKQIIQENQQLLLRKIYLKARSEGVNFFIHKDLLILGSGVKQFRARLNSLTKIGAIPWKKIGDISAVLITGTNGKTTTTRLTEFICRRAKLVAGYCSTDWVMVNNKRLIAGDLSGPTGHQYVLMNPKVEVAILEVARGGIIKRGLLPNYVRAATVTNIAHDHIGQNGIESLADLAAAKGIVYAGLTADGFAIINLDDPQIVQLALAGKKAYLSTKLSEEEISAYLNADNYVVFIEQGVVTLKTLMDKYSLNKLTEIPLTVCGLAEYNYENVLHAVALSYALGIEPKQIMRGVRQFGADEKSNFGRWNYYHSTIHGHLVVDIAHNPAGLENILRLAQRFRSLKQLDGKLGLMYGNTADRRASIPEIVKLILKYEVNMVVIKEFQESLRGSELGEMPEIFRQELLHQGYPAAQIQLVPREVEAVEWILHQAHPKDMYLLCAHEQLSEISKLLRTTVAQEKI